MILISVCFVRQNNDHSCVNSRRYIDSILRKRKILFGNIRHEFHIRIVQMEIVYFSMFKGNFFWKKINVAQNCLPIYLMRISTIYRQTDKHQQQQVNIKCAENCPLKKQNRRKEKHIESKH